MSRRGGSSSNGSRAEKVRWLVDDVFDHEFSRTFDVWHDRVLLHFLDDPDSVRRYVEQMGSALKSGGHAIIATFGPEGPKTCSGLPVHRYSAAELDATIGSDYVALAHVEVHHETPSGAVQQFAYGLYRRS